MKFDVYLVEMLGEKQAKELLDAIHCGKTVILSGKPCTGKTTLDSVLEKNEYKVVEDFETINIQLSKPLNHKIPDFRNTISLEQETFGKSLEKGKDPFIIERAFLIAADKIKESVKS